MSTVADRPIPRVDERSWRRTSPTDPRAGHAARMGFLALLAALFVLVMGIALLKAVGIDADGGDTGALIAAAVGVISIITMTSLYLYAWIGSAVESRRRSSLERLLAQQEVAHGAADERVFATRAALLTMLGRRGHSTSAGIEFQDLLADELRATGGSETAGTVATRASVAYWKSKSHMVRPQEVAESYEAVATAAASVMVPDDPRLLRARENAAIWRRAAGPTAPTAPVGRDS
jgi:hypothetical protein